MLNMTRFRVDIGIIIAYESDSAETSRTIGSQADTVFCYISQLSDYYH